MFRLQYRLSSLMITVTLSASAAVSIASPTAFPAATGSSSRVGTALTTKLSGGGEHKFRAELKEGFHFNLKAPNQLSGGDGPAVKAVVNEKQVLEFTIPKERSLKGLSASLYVCDDANTFCDIERIALAEAAQPAVAAASPAAGGASLGHADRDGFYHHDFAALVARAGREKKLILAEFAARWCPGCRRLAADVLPNKGFRQATLKMLKFHADMDLVETFDLAKRYAVKGVPTVLVLDSSGEEIARMVDYRRPAEAVAFIKAVEAKPVNLEKFKAEVASPKATESDLLLAGRRLLAAGQFDEAMALFKRVTPAPSELLQARIERAENAQKSQPSDENRKALRQALVDALKSESETLRALLWRGQLAALEDSGSKARADEVAAGEALTRKLLALEPAQLEKRLTSELVGEYVGLERFLVAVMWAELLGDLDDHASDGKASWRQAAELGKAAGISTAQAGPGLRYLIVLVAAEKFAEADQWCVSLIKNEPENKDLLRRRQVILNALKKFDEAAKVGEESRRYAEGRMEFAVIENLAKSYIGLGKAETAKVLLDQTLARPELKLEKMKSQQARLEQLRRSL